MEYGLKSRAAGCFFAVVLLISSFGVGNIVQSSAAAEALSGSFSVPKFLTGTVFAALTFLLIRGGIRRVTSFSAVLIPILTLGYVLLSAAILIVNYACLPSVLRQILEEAFSPGALIGGGSGFAVGRAVRYGASRGLLSNEAGCGTAAYAHASSGNDPVPQGLWGIVEVFVDTILLCTATAFVVLIAAPGSQAGENGMATAIRAYGYLGDWGGDFIALSSALYALASVVCWSYYGTESLRYLIRDENKSRAAGTRYLVLYSATGIAGAMFAPSFVWELSDCLIAVMGLFNIGCLCLLSGRTARETRLFFAGRGHSGKPRSRSAASRSSSGRTPV
jgi:AGCS family alanine or glycine:cation symporter